MEYSVTGIESRHIEIMDDRDALIGTLDFGFWRPLRGNITMADGTVYEIRQDSFWLATRLITRGGMAFAELKPDSNRGIHLSFENGLYLHFKPKSFWSNGRFVLTDRNKKEIATVQDYFTWKNFSYTYNIDIKQTVGDRETDAILLMLLIYCLRLIRMSDTA